MLGGPERTAAQTSEIVVVGSFTAKPGKEAEAEAAFRALIEPTHGEDGCILYALHRGTDDPPPSDVRRALELARGAGRASGQRARAGRPLRPR